jgi:hypothetical protein
MPFTNTKPKAGDKRLRASAERLEAHQFTSQTARAMGILRWQKARAPRHFKGEWANYYEEVRTDLLAQYGNHGAQYRLLCEMVASAWTHLRRAETAGLEVQTPDYVRAMELLRRLIDQAQRYTEARKSELIVKEVNGAVRETLLIAEAHLGDQPDVFRAIVLDVRERVMG